MELQPDGSSLEARLRLLRQQRDLPFRALRVAQRRVHRAVLVLLQRRLQAARPLHLDWRWMQGCLLGGGAHARVLRPGVQRPQALPVEGEEVRGRLLRLRWEGGLPGRRPVHLAGRVQARPMLRPRRGLHGHEVLQPAARRRGHDLLQEGRPLRHLREGLSARRLGLRCARQPHEDRPEVRMGWRRLLGPRLVLQPGLRLRSEGSVLQRMLPGLPGGRRPEERPAASRLARAPEVRGRRAVSVRDAGGRPRTGEDGDELVLLHGLSARLLRGAPHGDRPGQLRKRLRLRRARPFPHPGVHLDEVG
mmetsp:Transcript_44927/g.130870  ORF Transcript_44927/g.130870 Transcript_44927/m.130870 type:complete len:305 (+) Transcript_44927:125-1039(+)